MKTQRKSTAPEKKADNTESVLVRFYRGREKDSEGRTIEEIWQMNEQALEYTHDYIQWLFPLPQKSGFNPNAPILNKADIRNFSTDESLKFRIQRSFEVMLAFYGFSKVPMEGSPVVLPSPDFAKRISVWLTRGNHNYLRISRILNFLMLVGLNEEAKMFFKALEEVNKMNHSKIGSAFSYWRAAVTH